MASNGLSDRNNDLNSAALLRARAHPALTGLSGAGTVIIVIDYGFDLVHPALRTSSGETRFAALLDQNGARLSRAEINKLLRATDRAGDRKIIDDIYDPHVNYFGRDGVPVGAHGTWVASIAAGTTISEFTGVAPNAMLIGVQLNLPDSAWREEDADGRPTWFDAACSGPDALANWRGWLSYEDSPAIVAALEEGFALARELRSDGIVVNLSIGAWAGAHDPNSAVNRAIETIIATGNDPGEPVTAVVTGTGNAGAEGGHVAGCISSTEPLRFSWDFIPGQLRQSKLEIWTDCDVAVELNPRFGNRSAICKLEGPSRAPVAIALNDGSVIGIGENRGLVRSGLRGARLLIDPSQVPADNGVCAFDVIVYPAGRSNSSNGTAHAWLERDCNGPAAKLMNVAGNRRQTAQKCCLTPLACAPHVLAVAGLDNAAVNDVAIPMSGHGPRPWDALWGSLNDGLQSLPSPLLAAPASGLFGARSKTTGYMRGSGTSAAVAIVSGTCALAMQAASLGGHRLDQRALINALLGQSISLNSNDKWRSDIGFGALHFDASALLEQQTYPQNRTVSRTEELSDERTLSPSN